MKKIFFSLLAAGLSLTASAADEITSGTSYYIQNVESGLYLSGANNWGTRLTASTQGDLFTANLSDGKYALVDNDLSTGNKSLGTNLFTDSSGNNWTIEAVSGVKGVYTIKNDAGYIAQSSTTGYHIGYLAEQVADVSAAAKWYFLTPDEAKAKLAKGTKTDPVFATFLIGNANFSRNHTTTWSMVATNQNLCGGNTTGDEGAKSNACAESFHCTFTLSQELSVPNGIYGLTCQAFVRVDGGENTAVLYANGESVALPIKTGSENSMTDASNSFASGGKYTTDEVKVTVTDGKLTIGVKNESGTSLWCIWDNFQLKYYGVPSSSEQLATARGAYEKANTAAKAVDTSKKMGTSASNGLTTAKTTYGDKEYSTVAEYEKATKALTDATNAVTSSIAYYAVYAPWVELYNGLDAAGKAALTYDIAKSILSDYNNGTLDEAAFPNAANTAETYFVPYVRTCVKAQTTKGADFTGAIVNPNFDGNINGWTDAYPKGSKLNHGFQNNTYGNINQFMECWAGYWAQSATPYVLPNGKLYQTITDLPAGNYTLSADIIATQQFVGQEGYIASHADETGVYIYATCAAGTFRSDACSAESSSPMRASFIFDTTAGDCDLGLLIENTNQNWVAFDNVKLVRNGDSTVNIYQKALKDAFKNATAPTSITEECDASLKDDYKKAYNNADMAKDNDGNGNDYYLGFTNALTNAKEALDASITAYANSKPIRVAVEAGKVWTAADDFAGWSLDHEDSNFHKNTWSTEADGTGMVTPFGEYWTGGAALADGIITYKSLSGFKAGNYAVSMLVRIYDNSGAAYDGIKFNGKDITADGELTKVHVLNNLNGVYGVVTDVINVAADGGDINLKFEVKDANASWLVWKGLTIKYLGTDKTTDASAKMSIKGGKYATFCAPYVVTVPTGIIAYTVMGQNSDKSAIELTEVEGAIPANTPVIVKGSMLNTINPTSGVDYATIRDLNKGLLTGVLTDTPVPVGSYVMQTKDNVQKFRIVETGKQPTLSANKAYLTVPAAGVKEFFIGCVEDADETAIQALDALINGNAKIYDMGGRQLQQLQKGVNIVNGKKILVK